MLCAYNKNINWNKSFELTKNNLRLKENTVFGIFFIKIKVLLSCKKYLRINVCYSPSLCAIIKKIIGKLGNENE